MNIVSAAVHTAGTNIVSNGTVYMITDNGQRRPYTSAGAFLSYGFNSWSTVVPASPEDMALPEGAFIPPRDGKVVCSDRGSDKGTCYLITRGKRAGFVSATVFQGLGFSFKKVLYGDVSFLDKDSDISNSSEQHRPGVLINKNGTVYLVSGSGLVGIPSQTVLASWGYSFNDVVPANTADNSLNQSSIMSERQGAKLSPDQGISDISEDLIVRGYIDTHPALPTIQVSAPEEAALVLQLNNQTNYLEQFSEIYPYLSSKSLEMINKAPTFAAYLNTDSYSTYNLDYVYPSVKVFEGKQIAVVTQTARQQSTGYTITYDTVFVKENGAWKIDFIGTLKVEMDRLKLENPTDAYVTGTGASNLTIVDIAYESETPSINNRNNPFLVMVKNSGQTTIHSFDLYLEINHDEVYAANISRKLSPGQQIIISVPTTAYWTNPSISKQPGEYRTDVGVYFNPTNVDNDLNDNLYYTLTQFQ